ncbi:MAG: hypothetical protein QXM96_04175, partial [Candidatus Woesearchaeota archaeon]
KKAKKKAESQYISWILIFGLVIMLSYFLFNWTIEQAKKTTEQIELISEPLICNEIGFSLEGVCQKGNRLYLNITNTNILKIEGFNLKLISLYPESKNYLQNYNILKIVEPEKSEKFFIMKKGTIRNMEIMPFVKKNNKYVYCLEKIIKKENIKSCN